MSEGIAGGGVEDLKRRLSTISLPSERLDALLDLGLSPRAVARAVGVTEQALRGWRDGVKPRQGPGYALDTLRCAALTLVEADIDPGGAGAWFESKPGPGIPRPIDLTKKDPEAVLAAADARASDLRAVELTILRDAGARARRAADRQEDDSVGPMSKQSKHLKSSGGPKSASTADNAASRRRPRRKAG